MTNLNKNDDYFRKQKPSVLRSILGLFTFSTIIPINVYTTIDEMAKMTWFWPLINAFIGLLGVIIVYFLKYVLSFPNFLTACIVFAFFVLINGCHHIDGLLDFSDAVMVQGSAEKKINVMRDPLLGTGAITSLFLVGIITITSYFTFISSNLIWIILISEMCAKLGLTTVCVTSQAYYNGTGRPFIEHMTIPKYILSIIICLAIAMIINPYLGAFGVLGGILGGGITSLICKRNMKVATGDVLGASNEIARMFSLLIMLIPLMSMI